MLISVYGIVTTETWTVQKKDRQEVATYIQKELQHADACLNFQGLCVDVFPLFLTYRLLTLACPMTWMKTTTTKLKEV